MSEQLVGVAIGIEDGLAAVYGADGMRHLREGEVGAALLAERVEGKRASLRQLVRLRFGVVAALEQRIDAADEAYLDAMTGRLLTAASPDDL